jgi:hypothetical protein
MMLSRTFLVCLLMSPIAAWATNYYVSPTGNDANSGTSPTSAWKTLPRVQQQMSQLQPGDQVLFERGGKYAGTLTLFRSGSAAQPIVYGAYGTGAKPIITGATRVTGWTQYQGNIWRATVEGTPEYVIVNDTPMLLARYPNTGWLRNVQGTHGSINAGAALNQPNGHWNGATVVVRSTNWSYEKSTVSSFTSGTLNFPPLIVSVANEDWGFFLQNKLNMLDMAGEWYHDPATGHLYLWAPNNADPNTLYVDAVTIGQGFIPSWQQQYMRIQDLTFQGYKDSGVYTQTSHWVTVTGCEFRFLNHAITSSGSNNLYINNTIHDTYGNAVLVFDEVNTTVEDNTLTDIALVPGLGESGWGYMGIRVNGTGTVVRGNRLTNIGYIGIIAEGNTLVERNVVRHATRILNDGAGIAFDHCDGLIVRENIVSDMDCDLTSVATEHIAFYKIGFGIYFGNTSIKNTTVERNTVSRCDGAGIHVDHTMVSTGNIIRDNVLFDNGIQLSVSDLSNSAGTGAVAPYHVPVYNDIYSGNIMYSVRQEQLTMRHYNVFSNNPVQFGTFTNNKYFNPYEEISIYIHNTFAGKHERFTMEQWQASRGTDNGSARSPLRMSKYRVDQVLTANMVSNGSFDNNVSPWTGWPLETTITRSDSLLDNGALRLHFLNNNTYDQHFLYPSTSVQLQTGQMYRYAFSIQSDVRGQVQAAVRGQSQLSGPYNMWERQIPFDQERRDLEFFFTSDRTEAGRNQFMNLYTDRRFWVDNVTLERVQVTELDPYEDHKLYVNDQDQAQSYTLPEGCWSDVHGTLHSGTIELESFASMILYRIPASEGCGSPTQGSVGARVFLAGPFEASTGKMRTDLHTIGLLPTSEPYTAMGWDLANPGVAIAPQVLSGTGDQALVDWVMLELRSNDAGYTVLERRAALVRANGEVVAANGTGQLTFSNSAQGRYLVVRHRNHLPIMTAAPLLANGLVMDLTGTNVALYGQEPVKAFGNYRAMWPGDVNGDAIVRYAGAGNDRDEVLVAIGSLVPSFVMGGYLKEDLNLDGLVKYTGGNNDRDIVLSTIGGVTPTAVRIGQMP